MADLLLGGIAINEVLVDPNGAINYDTDGNGVANATDEFVELVNTSAAAIDISGVQLWDAGIGNYFTFPPGTILQPGAHAMVITGISAGGSLPTGAPDDLFFSAGRGSPVINNGGDNIIVYDPSNDEYIAVTFNGDPLDDPTLGVGGYSGFSGSATQQGAGENFGFDTDGQSLQRAPDGSSIIVSDTPTPGTSNVCFVGGTLFDTPDGPRPIEALRPGSLVATLNNGPQAVRWIYFCTWDAETIRLTPKLAPVMITRGALGEDVPNRNLRVSQQHRMLVRGAIAQRMFGCTEVLIAARHLLALPGIHLDHTPTAPVTYYHIMLNRHEVLLAEGAPAESLYLGAQALKSLPTDALQEIEMLMKCPIAQLHHEAVQQPARPFAEGQRAQTLVRRHGRNRKPLLVAASTCHPAPPPKPHDIATGKTAGNRPLPPKPVSVYPALKEGPRGP